MSLYLLLLQLHKRLCQAPDQRVYSDRVSPMRREAIGPRLPSTQLQTRLPLQGQVLFSPRCYQNG